MREVRFQSPEAVTVGPVIAGQAALAPKDAFTPWWTKMKKKKKVKGKGRGKGKGPGKKK